MGCIQSSSFITRRRRDSVTAVDSQRRRRQSKRPVPRHEFRRRRDSVTAVDSQRRRRHSKRPAPQHEFLSDNEKELVMSTWRQLATDPVAIGIDVFLRIFEQAPDAMRAFPSFNCLSENQLIDNVVFRSHATRFVRAVDFVMSNLDALDVIVVENLVRLGRQHAAAIAEFRLEYLAVFETAMTDVWAQRLGASCFDAATRHAWSKIFSLITTHVREGYTEHKSTTIITDVISDVGWPSDEQKIGL